MRFEFAKVGEKSGKGLGKSKRKVREWVRKRSGKSKRIIGEKEEKK